MQTIQPFIDLGWRTIALGGELKRLPNGKKTIPIFGKDWLKIALDSPNTKASTIGGAVTGVESGIMAIDCDSTITYNLFKALDPGYKFHFISEGKKGSDGEDLHCGTIVYEYTDELPESFKITTNSMHLDFLSNNRMTYLPTAENTTKKPMTELPELKPAPAEVIALLQSLLTAKHTKPVMQSNVSQHKFNLAPQVTMFVRTGVITKSLFRLLTPKDFRDCNEYKTLGYLHPTSVKDGEGSTYLSKVSAILGADASIDVDLYCKAIETINDMFEDPMQRSRLNTTIIEPMCEGNATGDDGEAIWHEDPDWEKTVLTFLTKYNTVIHVFYDYKRRLYYLVDLAEEEVQVFNRVQDMSTHLDSIALEHMKLAEVKAAVPAVMADSKPEKLFGFYAEESKEYFNTFISTPAYKVFKNPEEYKDKYKVPTITLQYLETLVPEEKMRNYLLSFLRRKLDKFEYSPVVLYFLGVSGSGKDTFMSILEQIIGPSSVQRPNAKIFLEKNNAWILDSAFIQLDEYGNQLNSFQAKQEALGLLKEYTGKPRINVRVMREDTYQYKHNITFVMTANSNPLMLDADDRRIALFDTPTKLENAEWVYAAGGTEGVVSSIEEELCDFTYYLATVIKNLDGRDYMSPPESKNKEELIANSMPVARRIAYYLQTKNWKLFKHIVTIYGPENMLDKASDNKIREDDLIELYEEMKGGSEDNRSLTTVRSAMKDANITMSRTSLTGNRHGYIYTIPGLFKINSIVTEIYDD